MESSSAQHIPSAEEVANCEGNWVGWLTPEGELEDIELGERVTDWLVQSMLLSLYKKQEDRVFSVITMMTAQVAEATSWRGLVFPPEWRYQGGKDNDGE